jgi:predicted ATPase
MGFGLSIANFYGLRRIRWEPSGVCALAGPNNAGKTTLLYAPAFMRDVLKRGVLFAAEQWGGPARMRHEDAPEEEPTSLTMLQGKLRWSITPQVRGGALDVPMKEGFWDQTGQLIAQERGAENFSYRGKLVRSANSGGVTPTSSSALGRALELYPDDFLPWAAELEAWRSYEIYFDPDVRRLRLTGSIVGSETTLQWNGANAFSVLKNWKAGDREHEERWQFVQAGMREAFPDTFDTLDFQEAGQTITVRFYLRGRRAPVPAYGIANGMLLGLLQLCAVASAPQHGSLAIDEPENGLHPYAIHALIEVFRDRAQAKDLTIPLATHSPIVLDAFNGEPDHVFVMETGEPSLPVRLDQLRNPGWLEHFSLGDLLAKQRFGAQRKPPQ